MGDSREGWEIGNPVLSLRLDVNRDGLPFPSRLELVGAPQKGWVNGDDPALFGPVVVIGSRTIGGREGGLTFDRADAEAAHRRLTLRYRCEPGLEICHHLEMDPELPVLRSWTTLENHGPAAVEGIRRFDALNVELRTSDAEPQAAYLLGWLDGPRIDAPGKPPAPFPYPSWIPRLLYGDGAPSPPPPPPMGWASPVLRLVQERLTRLPLRSGKRSTYDNHPWAVVHDPGREAGFFVGLEWSGSWRIDLEHVPGDRSVRVAAGSASDVHVLQPRASLASPPASMGFAAGDIEEVSNAQRRYSRVRLLPPSTEQLPPSRYEGAAYHLLEGRWDRMRQQVDAAAEAGFGVFHVDAGWWSESPVAGEWSLGLGDFTDSRLKFPDGLRALSDHVHERGMKLGLWFEFERVDIRTANRGRIPWKPEWLVHQKGYPYRSWCQHAFCLCLGVPDAAAWALENVAGAIRDFHVDWMKIDSNEWAVCDDASHGHGPGDGEWAQVNGLYHVLRGLKERFPRLWIENCAGGSQRGDLGMARFCDILAPNDTIAPSSMVRQHLHGLGAIYPSTCSNAGVGPYPGEAGARGLSAERLAWRMLTRLPSQLCFGLDLETLTSEQREVVRRVLATWKRVRRSFLGDRHVLAPPSILVDRENREPGTWEATQYTSPDGELVSVLVLRCASPEPGFRVRLKKLDARASYRISYHGGRAGASRSGESLMSQGLEVRLEQTRTAEVVILDRA
jgi:alpha-galactosidase